MSRKITIVTIEKPIDLSGIARAYAEKIIQEKIHETNAILADSLGAKNSQKQS